MYASRPVSKQAFLDTKFKYSYIIVLYITETTQRRVVSSHDLDNGVCFLFPEDRCLFFYKYTTLRVASVPGGITIFINRRLLCAWEKQLHFLKTHSISTKLSRPGNSSFMTGMSSKNSNCSFVHPAMLLPGLTHKKRLDNI